MKKIYALIVMLFAVLTSSASSENQSAIFGVYNGKAEVTLMKENVKTSTSEKQFKVELKEGDKQGEIVLAVEGYVFGGMKIDKFEVPEFSLKEKDKKLYIIQYSNQIMDITSGSKELRIYVMTSDEETYIDEDGTIHLDITFVYVNQNNEYISYHNIFQGKKQDITTDISHNFVEKKNNENAIYDLNGRRVKNAKNGIFIVNGKKMFIK